MRILPKKYSRTKNRLTLFPLLKFPAGGWIFNSAVDAYENSLLNKALQKTNWNKKQAALLLNLNRTTLIEKIKKKGPGREERRSFTCRTSQGRSIRSKVGLNFKVFE